MLSVTPKRVVSPLELLRVMCFGDEFRNIVVWRSDETLVYAMSCIHTIAEACQALVLDAWSHFAFVVRALLVCIYALHDDD